MAFIEIYGYFALFNANQTSEICTGEFAVSAHFN